MTTVLLTGAGGQVGWALRRALPASCTVIAPGRDLLDLSDPDSIRRAVRECRPDIILNPAAYTAVDKAESEADLAMAVNGVAPGLFAEEAERLGALLVHYSTDYVFDGEKSSPYTEEDVPNPQSVYGRSKLAGERAIQAVDGNYLILRTSWVYGEHGGNFVKTILRLARERDELRIVADQFGAPTWARSLAESTVRILNLSSDSATTQSKGVAGRDESRYVGLKSDLRMTDRSGIYHLTAAGRTSWHEYAQEIVRLARQYDASLADKLLAIHPIATHEYPVPAKRPANSVLDTGKLTRTFGLTLPQWQDDLAACVKALYQEADAE
ncbi:MAG: dTDP-4-dehydrorhamnose reductase [Gallionella sp.]|nr:dTDP-4-dehydrorhamnose reductase [Gallionella sp.]